VFNMCILKFWHYTENVLTKTTFNSDFVFNKITIIGQEMSKDIVLLKNEMLYEIYKENWKHPNTYCCQLSFSNLNNPCKLSHLR
jgi:hypothetical protein